EGRGPHETVTKEDAMADTVQFNLKPDEIPTAWYNILPDMAASGMPPLPPLHPGTHEPVTPDLLLALFPESLVKQEVSADPWIDIPGPGLDVYRLWRSSPPPTTQVGKKVLEENPDSPGSLGIAISEAIEAAVTGNGTKYAIGSVANHVLLHQTVLGQETKKQMEMAGEYPDVVIGCVGG